jgi:hypothetical protein
MEQAASPKSFSSGRLWRLQLLDSEWLESQTTPARLPLAGKEVYARR